MGVPPETDVTKRLLAAEAEIKNIQARLRDLVDTVMSLQGTILFLLAIGSLLGAVLIFIGTRALGFG